MALSRQPEGFSGRLQNFSLLDIVQMACLAQRTGRLQIQNGREQGFVDFDRGRIIHAAAGATTGEGALLEILCWRTGQFSLGDSPAGRHTAGPATIQGGWEHVLMEAVRKRDELEHREPTQVVEVGGAPMARRMASNLLAEIAERRELDRRSARRRRALLFSGTGVVLVTVTACFVVGRHELQAAWNHLRRGALSALAPERYWRPNTLPEVVVPAGDFVFQDGQARSTGAFRIDATEVTVWQYASFVDGVGGRTDFDHPNQPRGKGHRNPDWDTYRRAAFAFGEFAGRRLTPNAPAAFVDWFDACAYAHWRGRRLPTEEEWEKAGRGPAGLLYPWGNDWRTAARLTDPTRGVPGPDDVASVGADRSPYGAYGMAGNVSEWTATVDADGCPIIKGGNFANENPELNRRILHYAPLTRDARVGFRTVSD